MALILTPSALNTFIALIPSTTTGTFTTMFLCIPAIPLASSIISGAEVLPTSTLMGPSTMEQISSTTSLNRLPVAAMWDGFVVTPSRIPQETASRISSTFAVSMKNFMRGCLPKKSVLCAGSAQAQNLRET